MALSRRQFLKLSGLAIGALAVQTVLTACGRKTTDAPSVSAALSALGASSPLPASGSTQAVTPAANVLGVGRGIFPGRVVWAHNP